MKKILLGLMLVIGTASASFAQFTIDSTGSIPTGASFVAGDLYSDGTGTAGCHSSMPEPTVLAPGIFYAFQDYGNAVYDFASAVCTGTALAVGSGVGPGNTGDYQVPGSVGFGLNIAKGFTTASWAPICVEVVPAFGFNFSTQCPSAGNGFNTLAAGANPISVDLNTTAANRILYVNYIGRAGAGTPTLPTRLQLFRDPAGEAGAGAFSAVEANMPVANFILDETTRQLVVDFTGTTVSSTDILSAVRQVSFLYFGTAITNDYNLKILSFSIGSADVASRKSSVNASITSSKLYPNPVADMANVEVALKAASTVKVTLSDLMGKEVMIIAEGTFSELSQSFSVANLNKGIYNVNYMVNGAAAKSELLMVR